ncbi:MAG: hypothetical protein ACYTGC_19020, partial [Planctomycetota bacterium]
LFTIPALAGSGLFVMKTAMMLLGGLGGDLDVDAEVDVDMNVDGDVDVSGSTLAFKLLSLQSIAGFVMGFGWGGLAGLLGLDWSFPASLMLGFAFGVGMVWLVGLVMKAVYDLQSSGNIEAEATVGLQGRVYLTVPRRGAGRGQVQVVIRDRSRIYNAVSRDDALPTGASVRVVGIHDDTTLAVTAA